jgi:hypothetical protein
MELVAQTRSVESPFLDPLDQIDLADEFTCKAIQRCSEAWYTTFDEMLARGSTRLSSRLRANAAYRYAMPPLNTPSNVRDFIACVVHGMMVGAIIDDLGTRWLYAAQVASGNLKKHFAEGASPASPRTAKGRNSKKNKAPLPL